jgi:hypothetical protein
MHALLNGEENNVMQFPQMQDSKGPIEQHKHSLFSSISHSLRLHAEKILLNADHAQITSIHLSKYFAIVDRETFFCLNPPFI